MVKENTRCDMCQPDPIPCVYCENTYLQEKLSKLIGEQLEKKRLNNMSNNAQCPNCYRSGLESLDSYCPQCWAQRTICNNQAKKIDSLQEKIKQFEALNREQKQIVLDVGPITCRNKIKHERYTGCLYCECDRLQNIITEAEEQICLTHDVNEPGPNNDGFPSKLSFYIHQTWKRNVKEQK